MKFHSAGQDYVFIQETAYFTPEMWQTLLAYQPKHNPNMATSWLRPATIRPWARWAIPAVRCQRVKGVK